MVLLPRYVNFPLVPTSSTNSELLHYALIGLEQHKKDIDLKIAELRGQLGQIPQAAAKPAAAAAPSGKRVLSPEARARIAAAQRKRWAATRKGAPAAAKAAPAKAPAPKKRTLSPEARARIAAAQRKRWAAARKGA